MQHNHSQRCVCNPRFLVTMETKFGERPNADASTSSCHMLKLRPVRFTSCPHPAAHQREEQGILQLKLQQRRTREVNRGIMPPLKSSAAFHEKRRGLERGRTDCLKQKLRSRPEKSELIRMHILMETSAEPSLQAKQLQLKRARLADGLNKKISQQPEPMELVYKNILPVHCMKQAIIGTQFAKASGDNLSCDRDSNDSDPPEQSPLGRGPIPSPPETLAGSTILSPTQIPPPSSRLQPLSGPFPSAKLTNGAEVSSHRMGASPQVKPKTYLNRSAQRHKKPMDNGPKIKKLKYHQYIPPDQKADQKPLPDLDSSYTKILQQQQLFLQLQILSQQQVHDNYHSILSAPSKRLKDQLDEMKVAELKSELKLRSLPVYGTKNDLIERLRAYEELSGGCDITSSPTAGGTTGPGAGGPGKSSKSAANNTTSQPPFQRSSLTYANSSGPPPTAAQQLLTCGDTVSLPPISTKPFHNSLAAKSPEEPRFHRDPLGKVFSLNPASLQKHRQVSSTSYTTRTTTAPVRTIDKDKMLREKDKQIEKLTRMLGQKQRLVDVLKMQLENENRGAQVPDPVFLARVKQEPPDKPSVPFSCGHSPVTSLPSSISCKMDATKVTVTEEAVETEEIVSEKTLLSSDTHGSPQFLTQEAQRQVMLQMQIKPEPIKTHIKKEQHSFLQQATLQLPQKRATDRLPLQQQCNIHNYSRTLDNPQKPSQQRKINSPKQNQKRSQQQHGQAKQRLQQMPLKQQLLLKQQTLPLKQIKMQQQTKEPQQIQIQMKLKQQHVLIQKNPQVKQQPPQVSQANLGKQPGSASCFPLDLVKTDSNPTLVADSNGNHFLIALSSHVNEKQRTKPLEATNHVTLQSRTIKQAQNGGLQVSVGQQQGAAQCLSAPPSLKPFFKDQQIVPSGKNTLSSSSQTDCLGLDVWFSPLSPASIKTTASSTPSKDTEHEDEFIDMILPTGEMPTTFEPEPDLTLDCLYPNFASSPPPSPLQLSQCPLVPPSCDTTQLALVRELESLVDTKEEKQKLTNAGSGCLEDFLESTMGKPLLEVEPGGLLVLIDDLHNQMLCTPSILDHPRSPLDTIDVVAEAQQRLNLNDWLDITMGGETDEETLTLAPVGPQTACGIFSADFLDSYMKQYNKLY